MLKKVALRTIKGRISERRETHCQESGCGEAGIGLKPPDEARILNYLNIIGSSSH